MKVKHISIDDVHPSLLPRINDVRLAEFTSAEHAVFIGEVSAEVGRLPPNLQATANQIVVGGRNVPPATVHDHLKVMFAIFKKFI